MQKKHARKFHECHGSGGSGGSGGQPLSKTFALKSIIAFWRDKMHIGNRMIHYLFGDDTESTQKVVNALNKSDIHYIFHKHHDCFNTPALTTPNGTMRGEYEINRYIHAWNGSSQGLVGQTN